MNKPLSALIAVLVGTWLGNQIFKFFEGPIHLLLWIAGALGIVDIIISRRNAGSDAAS